ncbi:PREDICTED: espin-like protein [Myotis brandtii]|uniref:espin-like protein n=1 Tax=Myotis brandtii TaxID=109478 RepID=UPI00070415DC|nr:PREDICTED: espin-like protein [Myotis brandtii]
MAQRGAVSTGRCPAPDLNTVSPSPVPCALSPPRLSTAGVAQAGLVAQSPRPVPPPLAPCPGNQRAHNGATPVHDAAATGSLAELCWLVREGGCGLQDQDDSGVSPLHLAARFAHPVLVEWLLREGHAATLETLEGAPPLHHAAVSGDLTCLKLLAAAHRSSVNRRTRSGASPLYLACQEGHLHLAQFLVKDCGADVHLRALDGMSALHAAAARGHYSLVVWLVTFTDIGLTARDNEGATALHFAARGGHTPILDRLLLLGAPIMRDSWGGTPLHDAAENGQMEVSCLLFRCDRTKVDGSYSGLMHEMGQTSLDTPHLHLGLPLTRSVHLQVPLLMTPPPPPFPPPPLSAARRSPEDGRGGSGLRSPTSVSLSPAWPGQPDQPLPREQMTHAAPLGISTSAMVVTTVRPHRPHLCLPRPPANPRSPAIWQEGACPPSHPLTSPPCAQEDSGSAGPTEQAAWRYSQTHQAILGPFGELLTEDDLVYLEKQIADLQLRRRCQEYESQLGQLAAELQALLPEPLVSITVNSHFLGGPEPAAQRLGSGSQRGSFNSEDICGYIDRSFAFWKEKEAEMFSFGD